MPQNSSEKRFISTNDIAEILGIGKTAANEIMHSFEKSGNLYRFGTRKLMRVEKKVFEKWMQSCKE